MTDTAIDSRQDILLELDKDDIMITSGGIDTILSSELDNEQIVRMIEQKHDNSKTIKSDDVEEIVATEPSDKKDIIKPEQSFNNIIADKQTESKGENDLSAKYPNIYDEYVKPQLSSVAQRTEVHKYEISGDVSGRSRSTGDLSDFQQLFSSRHDSLLRIFRRQYDVRTIDKILENKEEYKQREVIVCGLVWDKLSYDGDYVFIELESPNTSKHFRVIIEESELKDSFNSVVVDEVVGVKGVVTKQGDALFANKIIFPDIQASKKKQTASKDIEAAFISDIHIGSEEFRIDKWNKFVNYVRKNDTIKYVFVAGDIVEGIGVYPNQDEELVIPDIEDQYDIAGQMFQRIPDSVTIFLSVGNHDSVRLAEPQPKLDDRFQQFFPDNTVFVGNPVAIDVHGISVLMYHGMSIHAISEVIPKLSAEEPGGAMKQMIKKRHLAPVYGKNVRFSPEKKDYLVIDSAPDVLHTGHVHKYAHETYSNVELINTATWQGQTSFQKSKGINPDTGAFTVINLRDMSVRKMQF